ncbi:MAG: AmpG family muropeptide MFS transporter [Candidatus Delongbacteria bacterium]|nr:AmpG family muropeptide MFS transporter [Candidatus Delongbacteria bacterium]MBN2834457.1 AmpG family muropeptide MFS transporter [Candidatus Delongbacteria bacterium]
MNFYKILTSRKMIVSFLMGFSCGLPLLLTISVLQAWMKDEGVDLKTIGLFSLVGLPYTLKFLWAPVFDRFTLPFLGRRKGWLFVSQILLMISIISLGFTQPQISPLIVSIAAFFVTFFSASQDIVVDAYRREDLNDNELGLGSSLYIAGYRTGMLLASGGGLILADHIPYSSVYLILGLAMLPGILTTKFSPEPVVNEKTPINFKESVVEPLVEYFKRSNSIKILLFIFFYKIGDTMAAALTTPFYKEIGFSNTEIGSIVKLFGFWATLGGGFLGGFILFKMKIKKALFFFGILQMVSTAGFSILYLIGYNITGLAAVIGFENITSGMGTAAYAAFMASITNKKFTATQYALLSSLMGVPRVVASAPSGYIIDATGWFYYFIICTFIAIPGLLMISWIKEEK